MKNPTYLLFHIFIVYIVRITFKGEHINGHKILVFLYFFNFQSTMLSSLGKETTGTDKLRGKGVGRRVLD